MFSNILKKLRKPQWPRYKGISTNDEFNDSEMLKTRSNSLLIYSIFVTLISILLLILFSINSAVSMGNSMLISSPTSHTPNITTCGTTVTHALLNGCKFEVASFSWLPPACSDDILTSNFLALKAWEWFSDPSGTQSIPLEKVQTGEMTQMYVSWDYHVAHCVFMWQKMHRALEGGRVVDAYIGNYNHTSHCGHMLMMNQNEREEDRLNTIIRRKFVGCGVDDVFIT